MPVRLVSFFFAYVVGVAIAEMFSVFADKAEV
jgi:hypothetical protein